MYHKYPKFPVTKCVFKTVTVIDNKRAVTELDTLAKLIDYQYAMREQVEAMHGKVMAALERAGRNRRKIDRTLDRLYDELKKQTGPKSTEWTEEYYLFLLEGFDQALGLALSQAVELEEYEWAAAIQLRKADVASQIVTAETEKV